MIRCGVQRDLDGERLIVETEQEERAGVSGEENKESEWNWPPWKDLPQRYKLIGTTSLAFVICNMDKVRCFAECSNLVFCMPVGGVLIVLKLRLYWW